MHTIVDRSKKVGIKSVLKTGQPGPRLQHLLDAIVDEFAENEDTCPTQVRRRGLRRMISSGRRQLIVRGLSVPSWPK